MYERAPNLTDRELYDFALDKAVDLTESTIGFFHLLSEDQNTIYLTTWNEEALKNCRAGEESHYPIGNAGNWVDCVRLKQPVIYNDFPRSPNRKGLPEGHAPLYRFMSIPVLENGKVRFIFGVGNKKKEYTEQDVIHIQLIANELEKILKRRATDRALAKSEKKYSTLFEHINEGFALLQILRDESGEPEDSVFLEVNPAFENLTGLCRETLVGRRITGILQSAGSGAAGWMKRYGRGLLKSEESCFEQRAERLNRWFRIKSFLTERDILAVMVQDITQRKETEENLKKQHGRLEDLVLERTKELEEKNRDLENFNRILADREIRMIEMKQEVNRLCGELGKEPVYDPFWEQERP